MLYRIEVDSPATTQALCVTPTRELAVQIVQKAIAPMAAHMKGLKVQMALAAEKIERGKKGLLGGRFLARQVVDLTRFDHQPLKWHRRQS